MTSKLVVNTIESDTGISSVSFASSISMSSTSKFHFSAAGIDIGADTNINRPEAGVLGFNINSSEKVRINSSGQLGIGTNSPKLPLHLHQENSNASFAHFTNTTTGVNANQGVSFGLDSDENATIYHYGNKAIRFATGGTERVRIDSSGNVNITGITTISGALHVGDNLAFLDNNQQIQTGSSGYMLGIQGGATNMGGRIEFRGGNSTGDIRMFAQGATSTQVERLRIKSDGVISFDGGTTAAITPTQSTASQIGDDTLTGGTAWFDHSGSTDYYGIDGDHKLTNGATYGKVVARNSSAAISGAGAGHTWYTISKTVSGTVGSNNWRVHTVAGWKFAWPQNLAAGATTTFYMKDAVESYGSPTIPATGDYYISWYFSTSQDRGTNGGSYYTDANSNGNIYWYSNQGDGSNPNQQIPRQGDAWTGNASGDQMHVQYHTLPRADLSGTIFTSPLLVDPVIQGTPTFDGIPMSGGGLVKDVQWDSNTASIEFLNADFVNCSYLVQYSINGNPGWYETRLQFSDQDGDFFNSTNDYISHAEWCVSTSNSPTINDTSNQRSGYARSIWLTGNGANYKHTGWVWIIPSKFRHNRGNAIPQRWGNGTEYAYGLPHIHVRGHAHLHTGQDSSSYREEGGGVYRGANDVYRISGFRLFGAAPSNPHTPDSNGSDNGHVRIFRFKGGL